MCLKCNSFITHLEFDGPLKDSIFGHEIWTLYLSYEKFSRFFFTSRSTDGQIVGIEIRNIDIITKLNHSSLLFLYNPAF